MGNRVIWNSGPERINERSEQLKAEEKFVDISNFI
jgi:hypothetical protein